MGRCVVSYSMIKQVLALGSSHFTRLDCSFFVLSLSGKLIKLRERNELRTGMAYFEWGGLASNLLRVLGNRNDKFVRPKGDNCHCPTRTLEYAFI
jgi:hypothetical protein